MDRIYKELTDRIPEDLKAEEVVIGPGWMVVRSSCGCGTAAVYDGGNHPIGRNTALEGKTLKELACMIDEPALVDQAVSVAAINAYYNQMDRLKELEEAGKVTVDTTSNSFFEYGKLAAGRDVAFVGHFCGLEQHMAKAGSVSVLEKNPHPGDYPAEMCDVVIPGKDFVFMTGATLANNTATHLLDLCNGSEGTKAIFVGPTTTMSEILFEHGAAELSGMVITDARAACDAVLSGDHMAIFKAGQKLRVVRCGQEE